MRRCLALSVRARRERSNGTILEFASLRLGIRLSSRPFRTRCARPFSPPPFALTAAQPTPPAPPYVCRVQPKHPCIACRTHPARAVPVPRPEHARTHPPPCCPHVAGAHVSGPGWRLPGCEETFFGAISTCATVSSQRFHARVRLLPCVVASCCLLWCLAVWPLRGYALGYLVNPLSAWPGFSRPLRLSTPVLEHMHKCRGGIAHARATTPSFIFDAPPWVGCLLMMMPRPARRS